MREREGIQKKRDMHNDRMTEKRGRNHDSQTERKRDRQIERK